MADHRHKRVTNARKVSLKVSRTALVAGPVAAVATVAAVSVGVFSGDPAPTARPEALTAAPAAAALSGSLASDLTRDPEASRALSRDARASLQADLDAEKYILKLQTRYERLSATRDTERAVRRADTLQWTTTDLNVWSEPGGAAAKQLGELAAGKEVLLTGREVAGRTEIVLDGKSRWVTSGYLSTEKPVAAAAGLSMAPCPDPGVESGLTSGAVYVYRSVCHAFPQVTSYGGWDAHGEHSSGRALDIMTSDVTLGTAIADFLRAHASELHLYDVIWRQHIWTPVRSSEGWRSMPSRGSATANHYDHVHVSVY